MYRSCIIVLPRTFYSSEGLGGPNKQIEGEDETKYWAALNCLRTLNTSTFIAQSDVMSKCMLNVMYFPICDGRRFRVKIMSMRSVVVKGDRRTAEGRGGDKDQGWQIAFSFRIADLRGHERANPTQQRH